MNTIDIIPLIKQPRKVTILSHRNPDGDALGSSLAMARMLTYIGHQVKVILPSEYPYYFDWLPDIESVVIADSRVSYANTLIDECDLIICLDFNSLDRVDNVSQTIATANKPIILIDHHQDPMPFASYMMSDPLASSTAELVYRFFEELGLLHRVDAAIATCLLTGIITDTGSFKFNVNPTVFSIVSQLITKGIDYQQIQYNIFNNMSAKQLQLLGFCLDLRMEVVHEWHAAIIGLNKADFQRFKISRGDTEGIVNYPLMVGDIWVAVLVTEQQNLIKFSFRSKGDIAVNELAKRHFNGGGHKNAAGGSLQVSFNDAIAQLKQHLPSVIQYSSI